MEKSVTKGNMPVWEPFATRKRLQQRFVFDYTGPPPPAARPRDRDAEVESDHEKEEEAAGHAARAEGDPPPPEAGAGADVWGAEGCKFTKCLAPTIDHGKCSRESFGRTRTPGNGRRGLGDFGSLADGEEPTSPISVLVGATGPPDGREGPGRTEALGPCRRPPLPAPPLAFAAPHCLAVPSLFPHHFSAILWHHVALLRGAIPPVFFFR